MRHRHLNKTATHSQHVNGLIHNNDLLSTSEQEDVLRHFAQCLRYSVQFLKLLACLHLVLAMVYMGLVMSGSPLVMPMGSGNTDTLPDRPFPLRGSDNPTNRESDQGADVPLDEVLNEAHRRSSAQLTVAFMERRRSSWGSLTCGNALAMLGSIGLFLVAGCSCWEACRQLRVDPEELVSHEPHAIDNWQKLDFSKLQGVTDANEALCCSQSFAGLLQQQWKNPASFQYLVASLSVWPTVFWVYILITSYRAQRAGLERMGWSTNRLYVGVTEDPLELILALWQPFFHLATGFMIASVRGSKDKLTILSNLKYQYDKL